MIILLTVYSYLLGNVLTGSIISKYYYKAEIRTVGSGNPGARNIGRLHGKKAFVLTFLGDALKGTLAVLAAKLLGFGPAIELFSLFAVIVGHVYPILYRFRGGKGISTFIGGLLLFNPLIFAVFLGVFIIFYLFIKNFTVAGLIAISSLPIIMLLHSYNLTSIIIACLISGLVLLAHRENLKNKNSQRKGQGQ